MKNRYILLIILFFTMFLVFTDRTHSYKIVRLVSEFGGKGEALGKFSEKTRIAFDKDNNLYVADEDNMRVQKLDPFGKPIMEITSEEEFLFIRPMDIAVDGEMNIYVADWKIAHIQNTNSPKIFNYGPCIHKFSHDGKFIATFAIDDLNRKANIIENAVSAIDTDGNFALMILPEKTDRNLYISADKIGNIYVLDQNTIYKINTSGETILKFAGPDQLNNATDIDIDEKGNIYVADTGSCRIVKFGPEGNFILSFGKYGDNEGQLLGELNISTALDGTIFVSDSAKYEKIFKTVLKHRKITDSNILVTGQDDPTIPRRRKFETVIRRFQRFDENGKFIEKILYRIDKSLPESKNLEFKALDHHGNLYLMEKEKLTIYKYAIQNPLGWSEIDKTFTYQLQHSDNVSKIDNFYDINSSLDFTEREKYTSMVGTLRFSYDMTEDFRVSLTSSLVRLWGVIYDKYPGERGEPRGYIQDDETTDDYAAARIRLDFSFILNHDPFKYRLANLFFFLGGGRYNYNIKAIEMTNLRHLDENLWWAAWAIGMNYDMGSHLRFSLIAARHYPPGFMNYNYVYWDERGDLYATGSGEGESIEILFSLVGVF